MKKKNKKVKFIECDEFSQIYNWQRTMKRSSFTTSGEPSLVPDNLSKKDLEKIKYAAKKRSEFVKKWAKKNLKLKP